MARCYLHLWCYIFVTFPYLSLCLVCHLAIHLTDKIRQQLSGKLSSLPATFQALGVLVSYAVGLALDWHQLAWFSFYFAFPISISSFSPFWTCTRLTSTGILLLSSYSLSLSSVFCNHQLVTHFLNLAWIWIICSSKPIIFGNHHWGGSCLVGLLI